MDNLVKYNISIKLGNNLVQIDNPTSDYIYNVVVLDSKYEFNLFSRYVGDVPKDRNMIGLLDVPYLLFDDILKSDAASTQIVINCNDDDLAKFTYDAFVGALSHHKLIAHMQAKYGIDWQDHEMMRL